MKSQHQIIFKQRRTGRPRPKPTANLTPHPKTTTDVIRAQVAIGERELKFARALSDTEKHVRDAALHSLTIWLDQHAAQLDDAQMASLWKALFYCIWMADKRRIITQTIHNVVQLTDVAGWPFLDALFACLVREWAGIDRHRVDKFYELLNVAIDRCVRDVLSAGNEHFVTKLENFIGVVRTRVLDTARKSGPGIAMHFYDVFVERILIPLLVHGKKLPGNDKHKVFNLLMEDVFKMTASSDSFLFSVGKRIRERILGRIIEVVSSEEVALSRKDQRDMISRASKKIFAVAAAESTPDDIRVWLYDLRAEMKAFVAVCEEKTAEEKLDGKKNDV